MSFRVKLFPLDDIFFSPPINIKIVAHINTMYYICIHQKMKRYGNTGKSIDILPPECGTR